MTLTRRDEMFSPELRLPIWQREAARLAVCGDCYGSGEDRDREGRACPTCAGVGKAAAEPHVLELLSMVRSRDAQIEQLARDRYSEQERAKRAEALMAETVERLMHSETENDALLAEVDRLRGDLYRLRDERQRTPLAGALFEAMLEAEAAVAADRLARKERE